jgi:hypothetical protein
MFVRGRYTSLAGLLYTWLPWILLVALWVRELNVSSVGFSSGPCLLTSTQVALC